MRTKERLKIVVQVTRLIKFPLLPLNSGWAGPMSLTLGRSLA